MKVIKKVALILGFVVMFGTSQAQEFSYGLQVGSNFAVQSSIGDIYDNDDIGIGLHAGVFGCYVLNEKIGFKVELNYDKKGSETDAVKNQYDYLTLPILANYNLYTGTKTPVGLDFYIGPYAAYLLSANSEPKNVEIDDIDMYDSSNAAEFGLVSGFVIKYPVNHHNILLNLRYGMGLTSFNKDNSDPKNKYVGIGIGYEF